jgi:hypothetical protein
VVEVAKVALERLDHAGLDLSLDGLHVSRIGSRGVGHSNGVEPGEQLRDLQRGRDAQGVVRRSRQVPHSQEDLGPRLAHLLSKGRSDRTRWAVQQGGERLDARQARVDRVDMHVDHCAMLLQVKWYCGREAELRRSVGVSRRNQRSPGWREQCARSRD